MNILTCVLFMYIALTSFLMNGMNYNMAFNQDRPLDGLPPLPSQYYIPVYPTLHHSHAPESCVNTDQCEEAPRIPKKKYHTRCGR